MSSKPSNDYLSTTEASNWLSRIVEPAKNWVYALESNRRGKRFTKYGTIPYCKVGKRVYYHKDDLVEFARKNFGITWATT
ncbi:helix-turn-helix domain-containing protein [Marinobacter adhaerens]|jgi:hypothetical protein|uniref:helix-turn-helix domain-containing protein n=1 Tax=Marinobacter adhaerens TaxID=1033846 RepID=UPI001E58BD8D|nr:helix-turn-helix domain-containing protein [Marinobacter adhaerens]MCD1645752.1 helix-turn-helix domain-containing protein [Marinobacter adhaerens]